MAPSTVKKSFGQFCVLQRQLKDRLSELASRRQSLTVYLNEHRCSINETSPVSSVPDGRVGSLLLVDEEGVRMEMCRLTSQITELLVEILTIKLSYIEQCVKKLADLSRSNPRMIAPLELRLSHFDDWVQTNQKLYQLNLQLYDLQKQKRRLEKQKRSYQQQQNQDSEEEVGEQPVTFSLSHLNQTMVTFSLDMPQRVQLYVVDRLSPQHGRLTVEARKIQEFVAECEQFQGGTLEIPPKDEQGYIRGAHPQSYKEFMADFCSYINDRHRLTQLEELDQYKVYITVEHHLMPKIKHLAMNYVHQDERDARIREQCEKFRNITLSQIFDRKDLRGKELVPFADAIAHLKATYFSQNPTDKMISVMAAAKAVYEKLGDITVDADSFMDVWIYVCIKANLKNMATNWMFMEKYANPHLSTDEEGYYLATLNAAMNYIENLAEDKLLKQQENNTLFIVCECERARQLSSLPGNCFEILSDGKLELTGYKAAVVRDWVLDTSRFFRSVLIPSTNPEDKVTATLLRLTHEHSTPQHVELCYRKMTEEGVAGLSCVSLPQGQVLQADPSLCSDGQLIILPSGNVDEHLPVIRHTLQLILLGSSMREMPSDEPAIIRSQSYAHPGSLGDVSVGSPPGTCAVHRDETELDMFANVDQPKRTRSRLSLPVRKARLIKYQPLHKPEDKIKPSKRHAHKPETITVTAEVHEESPESAAELVPDFKPPSGSFPGSHGYLNKTFDIVESGPAKTFEDKEDDCFCPEYVAKLEENFCHNHLYGSTSVPIEECIHRTVKLTQIWLQRLNYLSTMHGLSGVYDGATVKAVKVFQVCHNRHDAFSIVILPETGILTFTTFQYLKQELLTIFSNMMRLRKDTGRHFLNTFDHMSTDTEEILRFRRLVRESQEIIGVTRCQRGVLCSRTVAQIRRILKTNSLLLQSRNELALTL